MQAREGEWHGTIVLRTADAVTERSIDGDSCAGVAAAAEVILGMALGAPGEPPPDDAGGPASGEGPPLRSRVLPAPEVAVGATLVADVGALPSVSGGGGLLASLHAGRLVLETEVDALLPREAVTSARPNEGADFFAVRAGLRACYALTAGDDVLAACGGGGADWTHARGFGAEITRNADLWAGYGSAGALGLVRLGPHLWARASAEAAIPLLRPTFSIEGTGYVYRPPPVLVRGSFGAEVRF